MKTGALASLGLCLICLGLASSCTDEEGTTPTVTVSVCIDCHGGLSSGSHSAHVSVQGYECTVCHDGYYSSPTHDNGVDETTGLVSFDAGNPGGTYNEGTSGCASLYCHGPATVIWGGAAPACGDCHAVVPTSGSHVVHTGNDFSAPAAPKYAFACGECHYGVGPGTPSHVDFVTDVVLNSTAGALATGYGANGGNTPVWNPSTSSCGYVYCHSSGATKEKGGAYDSADIGSSLDGTLSYNTPVWGGAVSCGDCHAGAPLGTTLQRDVHYPDSGEHNRNKHSDSPSERPITGFVPCASCRATSLGDARQGTYGTDQHVDGALDFHPYRVSSGGTVQNPEGADRSYQDGHCGNSFGCWY